MTIDGFDAHDTEAFAGHSPELAHSFFEGVQRAAKLASVTVEGVEHIPAGRALLVANHAFGWDITFAMAAIHSATKRPVFALGEHLWWKVPYLRRVATAVGVVDGTQENLDRLLSEDQLVLVMPGGMREALKPRDLRYRLLWGDRYGFVRAAIRHRAPIVPIAAFGVEELFRFVGDAHERGERLLGRWGLGWIPVPRPAHLLPWPHLARLRHGLHYVIGEPIAPLFGPELADDPHALRVTRLLAQGALHELIDEELARRAHVATHHRGV